MLPKDMMSISRIGIMILIMILSGERRFSCSTQRHRKLLELTGSDTGSDHTTQEVTGTNRKLLELTGSDTGSDLTTQEDGL